MEPGAIHDLTAAYALDALDEVEEREYEEHLAHCERCRSELASLTEASAALAYAAAGPAPPPSLRGRIVDAARAERSNVVPLRRTRWTLPLGAVAAAAACVAVALGAWGLTAQRSLDRERAAAAVQQRALALLSDPAATRRPLDGAEGAVVVGEQGSAAIVVTDLDRAPSGRTYEAWVIEPGGAPRPAGLFDGSRDVDVVPLTRRVPEGGATVAVTLERAGGASAPTGTPLFAAEL